MAVAIKALEQGINQTIDFFKGKGMLKKWASFAFLIFLFSLFTGDSLSGGGGFNFNSAPDFSGLSEAFENNKIEQNFPYLSSMETLEKTFNEWLPAILAILSVILIVAIILRIIGNSIFFSILGAIEKNKVDFGTVKNNIGKGIDLTMVEIVIGLLSLPFVIMFLAGVASVFMNFIFGITGSSGSFFDLLPFMKDQGLMIILLIVGFCGMIFFGVLEYFFKQFGVYLMHKKGIGAFKSLIDGIRLGVSNIVELLILMVTQIGIGFGISILSGLLVLIIMIPSALLVLLLIGIGVASGGNLIIIGLLAIIGFVLLLAVLYVSAFILTPLYIFVFRYNLNVLDGFLAIKKK